MRIDTTNDIRVTDERDGKEYIFKKDQIVPRSEIVTLKKNLSEKDLATDGAVGDLGCCFFDANGNGRKDWEFFLTAGHYSDNSEYRGVEFYRHLVRSGKQVVVVAGIYKVPAILAALKGKLFNVWITDEETARTILTT